MEIREHVRKLAAIVASEKPNTRKWDVEEMIVVSAATRRIAYAYERFRNVLEPTEEDVLRRKAIWRILDRRLSEDRQPVAIATALLQELMRAHYIVPVPKQMASEIARFIAPALVVMPHWKRETIDDFLDILSVSIDRKLFPRAAQEAVVDLMYQDIFQRLVWADETIASKDQPAQTYIACHRALFAADEPEIKYHFFVNQFPFWRDIESHEGDLHTLIKGFPAYSRSLHNMMYHPYRERLLRILRPVAVPYRIVLDVMTANLELDWENEEALNTATHTAVAKRTENIQTRLTRRAWHAIMFLFFTKTFVAVLIELPYELFFLGRAHWLSIAANITAHPLILFVASITVRIPGVSNTERIVEQVRKIVAVDEVLPNLIVNRPRRYGVLTWTSFAMVYTILFMVIFWRLFVFLNELDFSLPAILIFVVFLGLVSFLAMRIRRSVDDIRVLPRREGAFGLFLSFVSLPILEFGRWLTTHISQINLVLFIMDLILEAPFKLLIDVVEEWFVFVRDRKEELV